MADAAYGEIKRRIMWNELQPGFSALEEELALQLGMSRTPVHEALVRLEQEGFVTLVPRRGMRVRVLDSADVDEIEEVLACLEVRAAERLAERRPGPAELAHLEAAVEAMDRALEAEDWTSWNDADFRFHRLLVDRCGNRHLAAAAQNLLDQAHRFRLLFTPVRERPVYSNVNHAAVLEAIRRGDPQTAADIHRAHKRRVSRERGEWLRRLGSQA